jgi:cytochrome c oxidase subunit 1
LTDTYYIVGHFHDTMFGGYVFPFFAAIYYWFPKMTGRRLNEKLGKIHFWLMAPSFTIMSLFMMRIGLLGMRRRIADYDPAMGFQPYHFVMTIMGFITALGVLVYSMKKGAPAPGNIWNSRSPEWLVPSPMPEHNYEKELEVVGEPYDYGLPGSRYTKFKGEE